jgi:CheY-like chemotaxis protein
LQNQTHSDEKNRLLVEGANKAARSERDLNEFVAHEVRNPISAALSACSFVSATLDEVKLLLGNEKGACLQEDVSTIESSLKYADDVLHTMLDLHRIDTTDMLLQGVPTDIKYHILHPVASMIHRREGGTTFEVVVECQDNLIVSIDRLRLKQIVFNLARNSAKLVKDGGFIRLRACPLPKIDSGGTDDARSGICLQVEDSGPVLSDQNGSSMFFAVSNDCRGQSNQGTGVRFPIYKKLVELMGGKIELDRSYDSGIPGMPGTRITLSLLCDFLDIQTDGLTKTEGNSIGSFTGGLVDELEQPVPSNKEETPDKTVVDHSISHKKCIISSTSRTIPCTLSSSANQSAPRTTQLPEHFSVLFVDDDKILRKLFVRSLRRIRPDWSIHEKESGEAALEMVDNNEIKSLDLIFMDQYMASHGNRLLGTETVVQMRKRGVDCTICGLSANDLADAFTEAGADAFLMKPFPSKPDELTEFMLQLLNCWGDQRHPSRRRILDRPGKFESHCAETYIASHSGMNSTSVETTEREKF